MKAIGYISDEEDLAIPGVAVEIESLHSGTITLLSSSPRGALYTDLPEGRYRITFAKDGYGSKWVECEIGAVPQRFRLLRDHLAGYMWPKWLRTGEKSEIRVHSPEQYQLTLWRYGLKKEFVRTLSWFDEHGPRATVQIAPDTDFTQTGMHWNNHGYPAPHIQQFVEAPEQSGLYYLWARTPSGRSFSFPWVVAPAAPQAKLAVLASTNTWNAYNNYGGRSNYINPEGLPDKPTVNARLDLDRYTQPQPVWRFPDTAYQPLSFERPEPGNHNFDNSPWDNRSIEDSIHGRVQSGLAPGEWRLLGWLEREGFAYDYYSEAQLHDGTLSLDSYNALILSVHPEYWTREMFRKVQEWVTRGGQLLYLGGNGVNCEVVYEADGAMRCLTYDDSDQPGGHESRMHRTYAAEAGLLGVVFTYSGVMTSAPYTVLDEKHWLLEGTLLKNGATFGKNSLHERVPGGASGHETDKISASSIPNLQCIAKGNNPDGGGADLVYGSLGDGAIFSVGSITWVSSLFPDPVVSRITHNALTRMLSCQATE
ncbi:carboxypeptidase-like regulatory domain-containing protein [Bryobacter aggregatus]|uniref:carboxypeptidase-like regulatory domain-containing protein n=1 Tax=Bryobacter aggregatus TaxID=360054 RepID=UPI00192E393E|nr:carboxypeptidase-like regulatory domain-containing protein [Bryobacter aggregatus]